MTTGRRNPLVRRPALTLLGWLAALGCALSMTGCTPVQPTATPLPTPTPTPIPTPTPTSAATPTLMVPSKIEIGGFETDFDPTPDSTTLAQMLRLFSLAPADHDRLLFVNLAAIQEHPDIAERLAQEGLILSPGMPSPISGQLDRVVLATRARDDGMLIALEGSLSFAALSEFATNNGVVIEPSPESHREYEIWQGDLFGLVSLYLTDLDESTILLSRESSFSPGNSSARLKAALDSADGLAVNALDDSHTLALVRGLPSGLITTLTKDCRLFVVATPMEVEEMLDCQGVGLAATTSDDEIMEAHILLEFRSEAKASKALEAVEKLLRERNEGETPISEASLRQENRFVRVRLTGHIESMLTSLMSGMTQLGGTP